MDKKLDQQSDEDLMVLYQNGSHDAFVCLYQRHSGRVFAYLKLKVSVEVAQDLLQEVFMKMHRSREQYSAQYPFLPWIFTIARNALFDLLKNSETKLEKASLISETILDRLSEGADSLISTSEHDLTAALGSLPSQQKRAVELRYLSDWSFEQIAEEMKTTPENTRQIVSRGIKKIRSLIKGDGK